MGENNLILSTTTDDLNRMEELLTGNSVRSMRIVLEKVKKRIIIYGRRLTELYGNEFIVKARIYNNADLIKIYNKYVAGKNTRIKPRQSVEFGTNYIDPDPHQAFSNAKFNIQKREEGIQILDSEIARINSEIMMVVAQLREYERKEKEIEGKLKNAEEARKERSKIGKFLFPTKADLEKDKIAQARAANILLLLKIAEYFKDNTTNPSEKDKRGSPEGDKKLLNDLNILRQIFWAHGNSDGIVYPPRKEGDVAVPLSYKLDFDDPGIEQNFIILEEVLELERHTSKNFKTSLEVDRYFNEVKSIAQDPLVSKGIMRKPDAALPAPNSMREHTKNYPTSAMRFGDFYVGTFKFPSFTEALRKGWKKKHAKLYFGLPQCPKAKAAQTSESDIKEQNLYQENEKIKRAAEKEYENKLAEMRNYQQKEYEKKLGDLPDDAPDWVRTYVEIWGYGVSGTISYEEDDVLILRGLSRTSEEDAIKQALKFITPGDVSIEEWAYQSILGYNGFYKNNSKEKEWKEIFVHPNDKDAFLEEIEKGTKILKEEKLEEETEWVAYVLSA